MHMICHSIQVNTILPDVAKQVGNKHCSGTLRWIGIGG